MKSIRELLIELESGHRSLPLPELYAKLQEVSTNLQALHDGSGAQPRVHSDVIDILEFNRFRALICLRMAKYEEVDAALQRMQELLEHENDHNYAGHYHFLASRRAQSREEFLEALELCRQAAVMFEESDNWLMFVSCKQELAALYSEGLHDYQLALRESIVALEHIDLHEELRFIRSAISIGMHTIYVRLEEFTKAKDILEDIKDEVLSSSDNRSKIVWLINYATALGREADVNKQIEYLMEARTLALQVGSEQYLTTIDLALGVAYQELGNSAQAIRCFEAVLELCSTFPAVDRAAHAHLQLAVLKSATIESPADHEACLQHFDQALSMLSKSGMLHFESTVQEAKAVFLKQRGMWQEALGALERSHALYAEVFSADRKQKIAELQNTYESRIREQQRQIIELEREQLRERSEHLEAQLAMKTQGMLEQMKALQALKNSIYESTRQLNTAEAILRQVRSILNESPLMREDWDSFIETFTQVHPNFSQDLLQRFPTLTKMELRICMLLKAQLNTDQIADLLSLSVRNIENHRYRVRKKMGLERNRSLESVL